MTIEPLLILNGDGCEILLEDGSTYSIDSVFNCVQSLLFCNSDNSHIDLFLNDINWRFRGNYSATLEKPISIQTLSDLDNAVHSDLKPLVDNNIISDLSSLSKNPSGKRRETTISFLYDGERITRTLIYEGESIIISGE